ncbi:MULTISPECIES: acetaldehyde dehydrogenase ExaC [Arthrobacter]|uniref:Aldehyde dehydrogenase family protein n=1 Tax=Arthrobacter caoxuetaonis TaxID=2886935 RepID=A0A9X1MAL6_9MICC|nr:MULTISPECIES: aldehyde dehydrogenase family protein [Arthrobacter]MCC3281295.1 aldehyde dehydrogenase family protein [Arthrobacter caoxuetaonis]MCC3296454.1 aldehyde dehydrogenase family protein [Arthrobacter caoxuetaonis]MCC9192530.1 aldehyde dehydrogenase family protein [Arthrobacter sp. zg-Y916]USQ56712.1 aldehyde dehydrogenase family protein [Arthrobacter caoxuetaonis]
MTVYAQPGQNDSLVSFKPRYENWIGGEWVAPVKGGYFENVSPVTGKVFCEVARGTSEDIDLALDAAHKAAPAWGKTSVAERANILNRIADRIEENLEMLAVAETWDNGKPVRETLAADMPLAMDHFRYFAGAIRAQEGTLSQIDDNTTAYHFHEPLGVVGQIIPWNFPILMATWKLAPALAAGNAVVLKPAEQTPASILVLAELIADLLPAGVLNIVNGFGVEAGKPLASSKRIRKIAFTGETTTGRLIMQYASQNLIPVTLELGGKSPNIFFADVAAQDDAFYDKALEGFNMFALNQGEVCTCPSRALVQESVYDSFMNDALARTAQMIQGNPLDTNTMVGAQASNDQLEKILSYMDIAGQEGAKVLAGGKRNMLDGDLAGGYYVEPTVFEGTNNMRIFQEEIFGPVVSVTRFSDYGEAMAIANDTLYGLGAGVWSRNGNTAYRAGRDIQAGRVWVNNYHAYPAHAAFGGYKSSGIGRENHAMMLDHYQQTKNLLVSYAESKQGFF